MNSPAPNPSRSKVLIVDDEKILAETLGEFLEGEGFDVAIAFDEKSAVEAFQRHEPEILLCDIQLPAASGIRLVSHFLQINPELAVLMITAYATVESAIAAFKAGARDYLIKPVIFDDLMVRLDHLEEWIELKQENRALRRRIIRSKFRSSGLEAIVGSSQRMTLVKKWIMRISPARSNVLITGESGTGKELAARAIHDLGQNPDGPFLAVNCAAIPKDLLENQLFGYVRGAFTGADRNRDGMFIAAGDGTVFLDEIGELPLDLQSKLLRVIENREVLPVGAISPTTMKARMIAATNKNLEAEVQAGKFRADLFYRLNVVNVHMPSLRSRSQDIPEIVQALLDRHAVESGKQGLSISAEAMKKLQSRPWPGNVRELDNLLERAVILTENSRIRDEELFLDHHLPSEETIECGSSSLIMDQSESGKFSNAFFMPRNDDLRDALRDYEREHIRKILKDSADDRKLAASRLGLSLSSLYAKIKELGL